eukprot:gene20032-26750_t
MQLWPSIATSGYFYVCRRVCRCQDTAILSNRSEFLEWVKPLSRPAANSPARCPLEANNVLHPEATGWQADGYRTSPAGKLLLKSDHPEPKIGPDDALVQVLRAGICSTDIEITRGYVPGFSYVLGHEFIGRVIECPSKLGLVGKRVVGEINCNDSNFCCADAMFQRNHAEGRSVLGIIGRDGCMSERLAMPARNLHVVPESIQDQEACFAEPLAAACRVVEQGFPKPGSNIAVIGDGKLGLLLSQVMGNRAAQVEGCKVTLFGRHMEKMNMVNASGIVDRIIMIEEDAKKQHLGTSSGILTALAMTRPLGTVVLKSTVSLKDPTMPGWSEIANDIVVNEKVLVGSRCGPMDEAVVVLEQEGVRELVRSMTSAVFPIQDGLKAFENAQTKGTLKVQLSFTIIASLSDMILQARSKCPLARHRRSGVDAVAVKPVSRRFRLSATSCKTPIAGHAAHVGSTRRAGKLLPCNSVGTRSMDGVATMSMYGDEQALERATLRKEHLTALIELKRLYRKYLRAKYLLEEIASPIYLRVQMPSSDEPIKVLDSDGEEKDPETVIEELNAEETERQRNAIDQIAEMQLTNEQLKASFGSLKNKRLVMIMYDAEEALVTQKSNELLDKLSERTKLEIKTKIGASLRSLKNKPLGLIMNDAEVALVTQKSNELLDKLSERTKLEIKALTFTTADLAWVAVDARNSKYYSSRRQTQPQSQPSPSSSTSNSVSSLASADGGQLNLEERLAQAEKIAEKFLDKRLKPALRRAGETEFVDLVKNSTTYLKGLWVRLNGGSDRMHDSMKDLGLPIPTSTLKDSEMVIGMLSTQLDTLEGKLQDASKTRESKLRKAGLQGRVQMAVQLKMIDADVLALSRALAVLTMQLEMEYLYTSLEAEAGLQGRVQMAVQLKMIDADVLALSRALAVLTMQLEMEYVYTSLEAEALDVFSGDNGRDPLPRDGSVTELELLAAEYFMMEEALLVLVSTLDAKSPLTGSLVADDILERLAVEIPDMRNRVGVADQIVFGGPGITLTKLQIQKNESIGKVKEAVNFMVLGVRILGSDISNASRVFMRAALGGTLKQREVAALRRTAKDVVLFVPFVIILIIPLTPLGHVLIFGFIQTYFPSLFPSCFTVQRQEIMTKYEQLRLALIQAQAQAEVAEDEAELERAAAAVALLTSPNNSSLASPSSASNPAEETNLGWFSPYTGGLPGWGGGRKPTRKPSGVSAQYLDALANSGSADKSADAQDKVRVLEERVRQLGDRFRLGGKDDEADTEERLEELVEEMEGLVPEVQKAEAKVKSLVKETKN